MIEQEAQVSALDSLIAPIGIGGDISVVNLLGQAGGFQWPILAVLVVGLVVLMLCLVQLFFDRRSAGLLIRVPVDSASAKELDAALAGTSPSLYARFLDGLLKVYRAGGAFHAMGDEVRSITSAANANYSRTERLVAYCSSTAGGLGTVGNAGRHLHPVFHGHARSPTHFCRYRCSGSVDTVRHYCQPVT